MYLYSRATTTPESLAGMRHDVGHVHRLPEMFVPQWHT